MSRVVITGCGVISAAGPGEAALSECFDSDQSAISTITRFDLSDYRCHVAGQVEDDVLGEACASLDLKRSDRVVDMAVYAAEVALQQAGLSVGSELRSGCAVLLGCGAGPSDTVYQSYMKFAEKGKKGIRPTTMLRCMNHLPSAHVSMTCGLTGPAYTIVAACASSSIAMGNARRLILSGEAERVLCVGTESLINPAVFGAWDQLRIMSSEPDPQLASRPFDAERKGMVLGEAGGAILLESLDAATARGATIRAELAGYGESSDAGHITRPEVSGQVAAMQAALKSGGITPEDVGLIMAHGTGTVLNDEIESQSVCETFGTAADKIEVLSCKSRLGHTVGASGVVEAIVAIHILEQGRVPANLNLDNPDPSCTLRFSQGAEWNASRPVIMKNSFGFGGSNAVYALKPFNG